MKPLNTINVVECADSAVVGVVSYPKTPEGREAAGKLFATLCGENDEGWSSLSESEKEEIVKSGNHSKDGWDCLIVESCMVHLTEEEAKKIDKDFRDWSGGFDPHECDVDQITVYVDNASILPGREDAVREYLMEKQNPNALKILGKPVR